MKGKIFWVVIPLIVVTVFFTYFNCAKNPTRYQPRPLYLYAGNTSGYPHYNIYVISTETDSVVDSISLNASPLIFSVSPDRRTLYARLLEWDTTTHTHKVIHCEIDTRTKRFKYIGPNTSIIVSPDGKYLFKSFGQPPLYEFHIFDAHTHQLVYAETIDFSPVWFDKRAPLLYGAAEGPSIRAFNYRRMKWEKTIYLHYPDGTKIGTGTFVLSPDSKKVYFLTGYTQTLLGVFDIEKDSLIAIFPIHAGGNMAMRPDGKYVYVTDPGGGGGCIIIEPPPTGEIVAFDTETNTLLPNISTEAFWDTVYHQPLPTIWMVITPDGKKGYVSTCRDRIIVLDLVKNEAVNAIIWPSPRNLSLLYIAL